MVAVDHLALDIAFFTASLYVAEDGFKAIVLAESEKIVGQRAPAFI